MTVTFAYQKVYIPSAFHGHSCPNMGPAAFWVISSVCDNDSRLCFCCPQKTFHLGRGRVVGKEREGYREAQGQKVCNKWAQGSPRSESMR